MACIIDSNLIAELSRVTCEEMVPAHLEANMAEDARVEAAMVNMGMGDAVVRFADLAPLDAEIPF
jgi:hypothetical protein